jgi:hypothetical protein
VDPALGEKRSASGLTAAMMDLGFKVLAVAHLRISGRRIGEYLLLQLIHQGDCPFLIREHARKFQWGCSHVTIWQQA